MRTANGSAAAVVAIILIASALAVETVRLTTASTFAEARPALASGYAPFVPDSLAGAAMTEVGKAALHGADPSKETLDRFRLLAALDPLRPEPFLVEAALAGRKGDYARARRLLGLAESRAPRSPAAHYLLADVSIREGKIVEALNEMAIMSRLLPEASAQLAPALAQYARTPGAPETLTGILARYPRLRRPLLKALSADPTNAKLVLTLAGPDIHLTDSDTQAWKRRLIQGFVDRGQYDQAYSLWRRLAGIPDGPRALLFNGDFQKVMAPPPFNWSFSSSRASVAEVDNGQLRIVYYGREDTPLASQLLLLEPDEYRFEESAIGQIAPHALRWSIRCISAKGHIMDLTLDRPGRATAVFTVPPGECDAQWLELYGFAQDLPKDSDLRIGHVQIRRIGAGHNGPSQRP